MLNPGMARLEGASGCAFQGSEMSMDDAFGKAWGARVTALGVAPDTFFPILLPPRFRL